MKRKRMIGGAVAATAPAQLVIRTIVSGLKDSELRAIDGVTVIGSRNGTVEIETPRYDQFTRILVAIAHRGGTIVEIAGNDDIMVTLTAAPDSEPVLQDATIITRLRRDGFSGDRLLVNVKVPALARFLTAHPLGDPGLEHVFDY